MLPLSKEKPARPTQSKTKRAPSKRRQIPWRNCLPPWQQTTSPRGSRKSARTAPSCFERPSQPRRETRFSHGQNAQSEAKVQKCEEQLRQAEASLKSAHAEKKLRAESSTGKRSPQTATGGCRYAIVLRGPNRSSSCGGMRRRLRGAGQKGKNGALRQPPQNSPGDCEVGKPSLGSPPGQQRAHFGGGGEVWWGWVIGGDTPWGSRGPPRALPSPPTTPANPVAPGRRAPASQRYSEGHRHTEHPQPRCPKFNARLRNNVVPRERRGLKAWLCAFTLFSSREVGPEQILPCQ